jgi:hypothetical protein
VYKITLANSTTSPNQQKLHRYNNSSDPSHSFTTYFRFELEPPSQSQAAVKLPVFSCGIVYVLGFLPCISSVSATMLTSNPKGESPQTASALEVMEAVKVMQQSLQKTDFRLQQVEEASKILGEKQKKMDTKIDSILKFLQNWNMGSEFSSVEKSQRIQITSPTQLGYPKLTVDE